jgi:hypothetical protein
MRLDSFFTAQMLEVICWPEMDNEQNAERKRHDLRSCAIWSGGANIPTHGADFWVQDRKVRTHQIGEVWFCKTSSRKVMFSPPSFLVRGEKRANQTLLGNSHFLDKRKEDVL